MYENEGGHYLNVGGQRGKGQYEDEEEEDEEEEDDDYGNEQYVNMEGSPRKQDVSGVINGTMNMNETDTHSEYSIESQPRPEEVVLWFYFRTLQTK